MKSKLSEYGVLKTQTQYLKMIAANAINRFGDSVDSIAYSLMMYNVTGSAAMMALVFGINFLPTILLQPIAGVMVDRVNKKRVMVLCDLGRGAVVAFTAAAFLFGQLSTSLIIISVLLNSTLEALRVPAGAAVAPLLLDKDKFDVGTALNQTLGRVCEVVGLALAAPTVVGLGMGGALLIDAATFLGSALFIGLIKSEKAVTPAAEGRMDVKGVYSGLIDGFKYVKGNKPLFALILIGMMLNFTAVPYSVFITPYVTDNIGAGAGMLSAQQLVFVVGAALGAFITPWVKHISLKALITAAGIASGLIYASLSMVPGLESFVVRCGIFLALSVFMGITSGVLNVQFSIGYMRAIDDCYRGRVSGVTNALLTMIMPVCAWIMSVITAFITVPSTLLFTGIITVILFGIVPFARIFNSIGGKNSDEISEANDRNLPVETDETADC